MKNEEELDRTFKDIISRLHRGDAEIADAKKQLEEMKTQVAELEQAGERREKRIEALRAERDELRRQAAGL